MLERWARAVVMTMVAGCGDDVGGSAGSTTGTGESSSGTAGSSEAGAPTPTSSDATGTLSDGMTTGSTGTSSTTGTGAPDTTGSSSGDSTTGSASSDSTTGGSTGESTGDSSGDSSGESTGSTTEGLVCGDPVESMGDAIGFGGLGGEQALGFAVAADGARYSGGVFFGPSVDLKPGGGAVFPAQGDSGNMWLNKIDAAAGYVYGYTWPTLAGYHCYVWGFAPGDDGSVVVVGHFVGDLDLDPGPGVDMHKAGNGTGDLVAFMLKLGPDGAYQWGRHWGSAWSTAFSVEQAPDGSLYVTGYFGGDIDLDPGPGSDPHTATGVGNATNGYLSKFDPDGDYLWGRTWGQGGEVYSFDVAVDADGNAAVSGTAGGPADLNPGPDAQIHVGVGLADIFVEYFQADGTWVWAFAVGGDGFERINDLTIDPMGRVWVAGGVASTSIDLDPGPGMAVQTIGDGQAYDGFVARYGPDGAYQHSFALAGPGHDNLWGILADCHGGLLIGGHFSAAIDLDPGPGTAMHTSGGSSDPFLLALDEAGAYRWSRSWSNLESGQVQAVGLDADQMVHAQINYYGLIDADAGPGALPFVASGDQDVLLQRLRPSTGDW